MPILKIPPIISISEQRIKNRSFFLSLYQRHIPLQEGGARTGVQSSKSRHTHSSLGPTGRTRQRTPTRVRSRYATPILRRGPTAFAGLPPPLHRRGCHVVPWAGHSHILLNYSVQPPTPHFSHPLFGLRQNIHPSTNALQSLLLLAITLASRTLLPLTSTALFTICVGLYQSGVEYSTPLFSNFNIVPMEDICQKGQFS